MKTIPAAKIKSLMKPVSIRMAVLLSLLFLLFGCKNRPNDSSLMDADSSEVQVQQSMPSTEDGAVSDTAMIDIQASFQGGTVEDFQHWVQENIYFPQEAIDYGVSGTVRVRFTVGSDGQVTDAVVVRMVAPSLDEEAKRVILSSPAWEPAKFDGTDVDQQFTIPVEFVN